MSRRFLRLLFALTILLGLSLFWAVHVAFSKVINVHAIVEITAVMLLYLGFTAPFLLFLLLVTKQGMPHFRSAGIFLTITAIGGYLLPVFLELAITPQIPIAVFLFAGTLTPAVTLSLTGLLRLDRIGWSRIAGLVLGIVAVYLALGNPFAQSEGISIWYALALLVPLIYGSVDLFIERRWPKGMSQLQVAAGDATLAFLYVSVFALMVGVTPDLVVSIAVKKTWPIAGMSISAVIATLLFFWLVRYAGAVYVSFGAMIALLIGMVISRVVFTETLPPNFFVATATLAVALLLLNSGSYFRKGS